MDLREGLLRELEEGGEGQQRDSGSVKWGSVRLDAG